jgi:opacity protein-like surface antigen
MTISSFTDINTPTNGVAFAHDESKFAFAYALHAGLGYKVSNSLTMELAYRYVNLGDAMSGDLRTFTGINNVNNPMHFRGVESHDIKLGVRWTCCEPAAPVAPPPVLMRRG